MSNVAHSVQDDKVPTVVWNNYCQIDYKRAYVNNSDISV